MLNRWKRILWVAVGLGVWAALFSTDALWLRRLGFPLYDSLQRQHAPPASDHAVMLWISEGSIRQVQESTGESWPWRREFFASLLDLATRL
jgi:CHASE2 domain-containing sensor protein